MKNVLITGATGGIGSSILQLFHNNNYNICVTGTNMDKLHEIEINPLIVCKKNKGVFAVDALIHYFEEL